MGRKCTDLWKVTVNQSFRIKRVLFSSGPHTSSLEGERSENQSLLHVSHLQTPEDRAVLSGILSMSRSTFCSVLMEIYSPAEKLVPTMDLVGEFNHFLYPVQLSHTKNYILTEKHVICQSCQDNGNPSEIPWGATKNTDLRSWPGNKSS